MVPLEAHLGQRRRPSRAVGLAQALPGRRGEGAGSQHDSGVQRLVVEPNCSYKSWEGGWSAAEKLRKARIQKKKAPPAAGVLGLGSNRYLPPPSWYPTLTTRGSSLLHSFTLFVPAIAVPTHTYNVLFSRRAHPAHTLSPLQIDHTVVESIPRCCHGYFHCPFSSSLSAAFAIHSPVFCPPLSGSNSLFSILSLLPCDLVSCNGEACQSCTRHVARLRQPQLSAQSKMTLRSSTRNWMHPVNLCLAAQTACFVRTSLPFFLRFVTK